MKTDKQFLLRNLITILCALCVIALFLGLVSMSVEIESSFIGSNSQTNSISGAVTYFGLRLNDLSSVKESGKAIFSTAREVTSVNREEPAYAPTTMPAAPAPKPRAPEHVVKRSAEKALQLIERLAKMRDSGILTDEKLQEKKDLLKGV